MLEKIEPILEEYEKAKDSDIKSIEKLANAKLPEIYVDFLKKYGHSMFDGIALIESPDKNEYEVFTLYGASTVIDDIRLHEDYEGNGIIPIADDAFNNRFIINSEYGKIQFVEYLSGRAEVINITDTFENFLKKITVSEFEDE